jgi:hypothetical protein
MTSSKPAGWRTALRYWWVAIKLTITAALTAVVFLVLEPGLATTAAESLSDAQRARVALEPAIALALLIVNVVVGRSKPRRRLRRVIPNDPVRHSVRNGAHHG